MFNKERLAAFTDAIVAIVHPSFALVIMLIFTIIEIVWMIVKGINENV